MTCTEAVHVILDIMRQPPTGIVVPRPNSQSYCIAASALQHGPTDAQLAINLFRNATNERIPADGRFVNAIFRCFGSDLDAALAAWKKELRPACLAHEARTRSAPPSIQRTQVKNLIAAYHGLLYVCGRALRPDIALRVAYAMVKEGIEPNDVSLNCYHAGKRTRERLAEDNTTQEDTTDRPKRKLLPKFTLDFVDQYENLFFIECTKYDQNDMRRSKDRRVRIIV
jgi:pentatricopeptide repeat protein